jgi:phenylpropionate dioxygenase-like ring-hydroxylating dioxygenase large terminal subunit
MENNGRQQGSARCSAVTFQELLDQETVAVPEWLRCENNPDVGDDDIPISNYTSGEVHEQEKERLWPRVWQVVCREEDVLKPGDHYVHDCADDSIIVVRDDSDQIRAFVNSCLHRGRALFTENGNAQRIRCPYHGFSWGLDGSFQGMPCEWDFQHAQDREWVLPEVATDTWGGFIFIKVDGEAGPLRDYLGVLPEHYRAFELQDAFKGVHVQRVIQCNWKVAHEAFLESFHSVATHPQILPFTADANTQYDVFGDHISRMITPMEVPSPHLKGVSEEDIVRSSLESSGRMAESSAEGVELPEGESAREFIGEMNREAFSVASGQDLSSATMAELQDAILYDVFPNFQVWAGYFGNIVYQFRPNGDDHESCIFDVRLLLRNPPEQPDQPGVPIHHLADDEPFANAEELGALGGVFDQDMGNLPHMMRGLKASRKGSVTLASYQESRIRHLHNTLSKYLKR